jgi:hypothetical protein
MALAPRAALPSTSTTVAAEQDAHPLHAAVQRGDLEAISRLVQQKDDQGHRWLSTLNTDRQSPLDLVKTLPFPNEKKEEIRNALLKSHNATAPDGYTKPSAMHGTPWGLEILSTGALKGGVNDAKGGSQSLEGAVFFSDRTPFNDQQSTTRSNLRSKARTYAVGYSSDKNSAANRLDQYKLTNSLLKRSEAVETGSAQVNSATKELIKAEDSGQYFDAVQNMTRRLIKDGASNLIPSVLEAKIQNFSLPAEVVVERSEGAEVVLAEKELSGYYQQALKNIVEEFEAGKAPFLGLLNDGVGVPVVFGFEELSGQSVHVINRKSGKEHYSYQTESHPLAGAENGGKLKEIEVQNLSDLATLVLGALVKGAEFPDDVMIRVKARGKNAPQARFLTPEHLSAFKAQLEQRVQALPGDAPLADRPMEELQSLNRALRAEPADLERWTQSEDKTTTSETR